MSPARTSRFEAWRPLPSRQVPSAHRAPLHHATSGLLSLYSRCNPAFLFIRSVPRRCLTKPTHPAGNDGYDNIHHDYILHVNDTLSDGRGNDFVVLDLLGTGTFGQVVKCRHFTAGTIVAVKVIKNQPAYFNQAWVEINILRILHFNNSSDDTRHIVNFHNHFIFRGHLCLVFERLSINLYELLKQNSYVGLNFDTLRTFLSQLLNALNVLVLSEVIHCDLKPENILLENLDTANVKIIDFGSACQLHYPIYSYVQSRFYRAPEVLLGCPEYDSKIDMWSLGCVAGELFLGIPLFPGQNEMNMVSRIVEMLGDMPDRFLRRCQNTSKFFYPVRAGETAPDDVHLFHLKSSAQYEQENNTTLPEWKRFFKEKKLRDIIMTYPFRTPAPHADEIALRESFNDLLNGMLRVDPRDRWNPADALQHPFMKGEPLPGGQPWVPSSRPYRTPGSKPILIQQPGTKAPTPMDEVYSASAPNFTPQGRLNMNTTWGTGAGGHATVVGRGSMPRGQHGGYHYQYSGEATNADMSGEPDGGARSGFAPGSYAAPPTLTMFGSSMPAPGGARRGSFSSSVTNGQSPGSGSNDLRAAMFPPPSGRGAGAWGSPSGGGRGSTSPVGPGGSFRMANGIHLSGSRESLTGSLRMSGSRESLGMGRVGSVGDMDDGFASEPEEKAPSPGMAFVPIGRGASAALPPPAPRSHGARSGAAYGVGGMGYAYAREGRNGSPGRGDVEMEEEGVANGFVERRRKEEGG